MSASRISRRDFNIRLGIGVAGISLLSGCDGGSQVQHDTGAGGKVCKG